MRCDGCGRTLRYREEIVRLYRAGAAMRAELALEDTPTESAESKFHSDCYDRARTADPLLPEPSR